MGSGMPALMPHVLVFGFTHKATLSLPRLQYHPALSHTQWISQNRGCRDCGTDAHGVASSLWLGGGVVGRLMLAGREARSLGLDQSE